MKTKIEQLIDSWVICMEDSGALQLERAIESILKSIESELKKNKLRLSEKEYEFEKLIHRALDKVQALSKALRMQTVSYFNGGIQREVQRPEYQQLKQCFIKYLKPVPWSYSVFIAAEVIPAILLILMVASMPGLALAAKRSKSASSESVDPPCTHLLKIDYAKSNTMLHDIKLQLSKMGVDYNKLPIQADISVEKIRRQADCFAQTLTQFSIGKLSSLEEEKFFNTVLNDDAYMEPLHLILTYAENEPLRYKIIAKLAQVLYRDIHSARAFNSGRLIRILGQAIMALHPDKLPPSITKDEIIRMSDMLSLYRRMAQSESAVNKQSLALRALLETEWGIEPQSMPIKENSYYAQFLMAFIAMMGLMQAFRRLFNRTLPTAKVNNQKTAMPEQTSVVKTPVSTKPSAITSSPQMAPPQIIIQKEPIQKNLNAILRRLNDLFEDLIIPDPYLLHWNEDEAKAHLELRMEQYYYNTQGNGKVFGFSKAALSALAKEYCINRLGAEERTMLWNDAGLVLEQPWALKFNDNTHSIKQCYAAFFKILRQLANVYYPMAIQLDCHRGKFLVAFSLNKVFRSEIEPYTLSTKQFLQCIRSSLGLNGQEPQFSIPYETLEGMSLPNEKEFLSMKKEACAVKEKELMGPLRLFDLSKTSIGPEKNIAITPLKTVKNR